MKKQDNRERKHFNIRKKVAGTPDRPRLAIYRSNAHIYAQVIDDLNQKTLVSASDVKDSGKQTKIEKAFLVGKTVAEAAVKKGVKEVVFDRGGFLYHGRIAKVAEGAREGGLKF